MSRNVQRQQELTSGAHPSVYAMDLVLTNYPSIDEGQIMIFVKAGDSMYWFDDSHSSQPTDVYI